MFEQLNLFGYFKKTPPPKKDFFIYKEKKFDIIRRPYRRYLGLTIRPPCKLQILTNQTQTEKDWIPFIEKQWSWIEKQEYKLKQIYEKFPQKTYFDGDIFLYLGQPYQLECVSHINSQIKKSQISVSGSNMILRVPQNITLSFEDKKNLIHAFYKKSGTQYLKKRVAFLSQKLQLFPKNLSFRSQHTRWGSCTHRGHISLNWKMIIAPPETIDYVLIHELVHLVHHNHGPHFWKQIETYVPNYSAHKKWLNENQYATHFLDRD